MAQHKRGEQGVQAKASKKDKQRVFRNVFERIQKGGAALAHDDGFRRGQKHAGVKHDNDVV